MKKTKLRNKKDRDLDLQTPDVINDNASSLQKSKNRQDTSKEPINSEDDEGEALKQTISDFEKLKFYTDLYKFYNDFPLKLAGAYFTASSVSLAAVVYLTDKNIKTLSFVGIIILVIGTALSFWLYKMPGKHLKDFGEEITKLSNNCGMVSPNSEITDFTFSYGVILLAWIPYAVVIFVILYLQGTGN